MSQTTSGLTRTSTTCNPVHHVHLTLTGEGQTTMPTAAVVLHLATTVILVGVLHHAHLDPLNRLEMAMRIGCTIHLGMAIGAVVAVVLHRGHLSLPGVTMSPGWMIQLGMAVAVVDPLAVAQHGWTTTMRILPLRRVLKPSPS